MIASEAVVFFTALFFLLRKIPTVMDNEIDLAVQKANFILSITHELKTPLASNRLYIQTVRQRDLGLEKRNELFLLNSNLTGPSENFPVYIDVDDFISVKPDTVTSNIDVVYVRKLRTPKWTMSTDFGTIEEPVFTSSALDYQDFELPVEAEAKLVVEILKLAGVTIRETEITQLAQGLDQQETQKENM